MECFKVGELEKAISIVNGNRQCNGASIFTTSGATARKFQSEIEVGQAGINVPVAVPLPFSTFADPTTSFSGDINTVAARAGVQFYTHVKMVTQKWDDFPSQYELALALTFGDQQANPFIGFHGLLIFFLHQTDSLT